VVQHGSPRLTADELVEVAAANGLRASRRLVTDWVSLGLLDRPYHPGRGRAIGGSDKGTWSFVQAQLFVDLLTLHQRPEDPIRFVAALANVSVSGWLWMGDASGVSLSQVRRALATWCGRHRSRKQVSATRARRIAREMLKQLDNPQASKNDRDALLRLLETSIRARTFNADEMRSAVERVFDPHTVERSLGPTEVAATAAGLARMMEAQATGYLNLDSFTDQEFEDARVIYRQGRRDYAAVQPRLAADPQGSPLRLNDVTYESVLNDACQNLLFTLGLGRLSPRVSQEMARHARIAQQTGPTSIAKP
jgi:hypothetical protein